MSPGCVLCNEIVPSGAAFLVLRGLMTGAQGFVRAEAEGLLCLDRQACLVRFLRLQMTLLLESDDEAVGTLRGEIQQIIDEKVDAAMEGMEHPDEEEVDAKRLRALQFLL